LDGGVAFFVVVVVAVVDYQYSLPWMEIYLLLFGCFYLYLKTFVGVVAVVVSTAVL
jgi:hypothetical protein